MPHQHHHHQLHPFHQQRPPIKRRYDTRYIFFKLTLAHKDIFRPPVLSLRDPMFGNNGASRITLPSSTQYRPENTENGGSNKPTPVLQRLNGVKKNDFDKIQQASEVLRISETEAPSNPSFPTRPTPPRPSELFLNHENGPGSVYDYSFMSSCSLPSDHTNQSTPSPRDRVTLRHSRSVINNATESGRLLNSALARHFRRLHAGGGSMDGLSDNLYLYIRDVFNQLDSGHTGYVSRQDFLSLCEILELDMSLTPGPGPGSNTRTSGLQWLSSYHPRPGTPASPIR